MAAESRGMRNLADALGLRSDFNGSVKNYLTYSVLGGLVSQGKVSFDSQTKLFTVQTSATPTVSPNPNSERNFQ